MNNLPKLKLFLKNNKLLLYDMDDASRNLLHLSIIARNHEITEYLLKEGLFLNGAGTRGYWDIRKISEYDLKKFDDLLNKKEAIGSEGCDANGIRPLIFSSKYNLIQIIYEELKKKNLVEKIDDIIKNQEVIGKRIIRKKELYMNQNINKNIKNFIKIYHGTKYSSIESIMKFGLKKMKKPLKEHIPLNKKLNNIENWADAIFVTPSILYASKYADIVVAKCKEFFVLIEGRIKKDCYTSHKITLSEYRFARGEPKLLEYRVKDDSVSINEKNENVLVESILFVEKFFLEYHKIVVGENFDYFNNIFNK